MKKDLIFAPILFVVAAALFFLKLTDLPIHIVISVVGAIVLVVYTVLTVKQWKIPALEIATRAFYGIALITGIIITKVTGIVPLNVAHKVSAVLFIAGLIALLTTKLIQSKKAKK